MTVFDEVQWKVLTQDLCHEIGGIWSSEWVQCWVGLSMTVTDDLTTVHRSWKKCCGWHWSSCPVKPIFVGHNSFLARQLQIFIVTYLYKTKFLIHQKGKGPDKVSGHPRIWRDKAYFWPDIVCWPAVISSPSVVFNFRAKVSCIMSVDGIKLWLLIW